MMKLIVCIALSCVALLADVTGKWTGTYTLSTPDGAQKTTAFRDRKQDGNDVSGTAGTDSPMTIKNGKIDGNTLRFEVPTDQVTYRVTLTVDGDSMSGTAAVGQEGHGAGGKLDFKRDKQ